MTVLYSFPFSCSLAVDFVLRQNAQVFEKVIVERGHGRRVRPGDSDATSRKRKVPALDLDGEVLTEIVVILDELDRRFVPTRTAGDRRRVLEWSCFVSTELHQAVLAPLYDPDTPDVAKRDVVTRLLPPAIEILERALVGRNALVGDEPSGADAYLLWALLLVANHGRDHLGPETKRFRKSMLALSFVAEAVTAETAALS